MTAHAERAAFRAKIWATHAGTCFGLAVGWLISIFAFGVTPLNVAGSGIALACFAGITWMWVAAELRDTP